MRFLIVFGAAIIVWLSAFPAAADLRLYEWGYNVNEDPFEGEGRFSMGYLSTWESGVFVICQQGGESLTVRVAFPFDAADGENYDGSTMRIKVDKFNEFAGNGNAIALQNGNAGMDLDLERSDGISLLENLRD